MERSSRPTTPAGVSLDIPAFDPANEIFAIWDTQLKCAVPIRECTQEQLERGYRAAHAAYVNAMGQVATAIDRSNQLYAMRATIHMEMDSRQRLTKPA